MVTDGTSGDPSPQVGGARPVPLNSRQVTTQTLRSVATSLGLPTTASAEDLRQMIDGQLVERGRQPRDVQVVVEATEAETPGRVLLQDGDGGFLEARLLPGTEPDMISEAGDEGRAERPDAGGMSGHTPDREADTELIAERDRLAADVERYRVELESLRADAEKSKLEVQGARKRLKEVWRMNCDQLIAHEEELTAKDAEIAGLKSRLSTAVGTPPKEDSRDDVSEEVSEGRVYHSFARSTRRGKAPPIDPFSADDGVVRLTTGCRLLTGQRPGMLGQMRRSYCNLLVTCEAGLSRSGT